MFSSFSLNKYLLSCAILFNKNLCSFNSSDFSISKFKSFNPLIYLSILVEPSTKYVNFFSNMSEFFNDSESLVFTLILNSINTPSLLINSFNLILFFKYSSNFTITLS